MSTTSNLGLFKHDNPSTNTDQFNIGKALNENWDKLDAEAGDTREKLERLKVKNNLLKQDIQASQITETIEGKSLKMTDCASVRLSEFVVGGNSEQETRNGKNLFKVKNLNTVFNGITIKQDSSSGKIILNGTTTATWNHNLFDNVNILLNSSKQYTVSIKTSGSISGGVYSIYGRYEDDTTIWDKSYSYYPYTFTGADKNIKSYNLYINNGITFNNYTIEIQLEEGTQATTYEPYGVSPSPEYPSKIKSVGDSGSIEIKQTNANLLNPQKIVEDSNNNYVYIENGYIKYATDSSRILLRPVLIKENTSYTYKLICKSGVDTTNSIKFTAIYQDGSTENLVDKIQTNQSEFTLIFKTNNLKTLDCVRSAYTDGKIAYVKINGSMILEGDRTSDIGNIEYIPNEEKTHLISINEPLKSLPNGTCDILKINSVTRKIGKIILDGNFNIITLGTNTLGYTWVILPNDLAPLAKKGEKRKPFCNIAIGSTETGYQNFNSSKIIQWHNTTASFVMTLPTEIVGSTISQVKTYFQEQYNNGNPVIVYYELAEETIEPYTEEQQSAIDEIINNQMYKGITYLFSNDEVSPNLKAIYAKDLTTIINNITTAIIAEGGV